MNVLDNDGSSIDSHSLDLIAPPKVTSEITQLPPLNQKRFLRDLRNGKFKHICVFVAEDEYSIDIRPVTKDGRVNSSSSMDGSSLDEKTQIKRYTSQLWDHSMQILSTMI